MSSTESSRPSKAGHHGIGVAATRKAPAFAVWKDNQRSQGKPETVQSAFEGGWEMALLARRFELEVKTARLIMLAELVRDGKTADALDLANLTMGEH